MYLEDTPTPYPSARGRCKANACAFHSSQGRELESESVPHLQNSHCSGAEWPVGHGCGLVWEDQIGPNSRALNGEQSNGLFRAISPSITATDASPIGETIERIMASFDHEFGQLPLPDLSVLFPDLDDFLEECSGNEKDLSYG